MNGTRTEIALDVNFQVPFSFGTLLQISSPNLCPFLKFYLPIHFQSKEIAELGFQGHISLNCCRSLTFKPLKQGWVKGGFLAEGKKKSFFHCISHATSRPEIFFSSAFLPRARILSIQIRHPPGGASVGAEGLDSMKKEITRLRACIEGVTLLHALLKAHFTFKVMSWTIACTSLSKYAFILNLCEPRSNKQAELFGKDEKPNPKMWIVKKTWGNEIVLKKYEKISARYEAIVFDQLILISFLKKLVMTQDSLQLKGLTDEKGECFSKEAQWWNFKQPSFKLKIRSVLRESPIGRMQIFG